MSVVSGVNKGLDAKLPETEKQVSKGMHATSACSTTAPLTVAEREGFRGAGEIHRQPARDGIAVGMGVTMRLLSFRAAVKRESSGRD